MYFYQEWDQLKAQPSSREVSKNERRVFQPPAKLCDRVEQERLKQRLSMDSLSQKLQVPTSCLIEYERGARDPTPQHERLILEWLTNELP